VTSDALTGNQLTDDVTEKPEVKCEVIENGDVKVSRSSADVKEDAEPSTGLTNFEMVSSDMEMRQSSCNSGSGRTTNDSVVQNYTVEESTSSDQSVIIPEATSPQTVEQPPQLTESFGANPEEDDHQDQRSSISSDHSQMVSSCHEVETGTKDQISTGSASVGGLDFAPEEDSLCTESGGMTFQPNQLPETPTQPDLTLNELITSPEPEMAIKSDEVLASPEAQQIPSTGTVKEQISMAEPETPTKPDPTLNELITSAEPEMAIKSDEVLESPEAQQEPSTATVKEQISTAETDSIMRDEINRQSEVQSSMSDQHGHGQDAASTAQESEQLRSSGANEASEDQRYGAVEQTIQAQLDENSASSEHQNDAVKLTSATPVNNTSESRSKETAEKTIQAGVVLADSTSSEQPGLCDEPPTTVLPDQELRSSVPSGTETETLSMSKTNVEPCTFTFPEPPQHPYVAVGDDGTDDVFVQQSPPQNDATASEEIPSATVMTSSTTAAAATEALDVSRQELTQGDELVLADTASVPPPTWGLDEVIPNQPPTPGGESYEAQVPPTSDAAAAVATAPAKDGERPAEKSFDDIPADEFDFVQADKLKTLSPELCPSSGDFLTATESTDAAHQQQLDEVLQDEVEPGTQQTSGRADRRQLSLPIHGHDSDLQACDNQVGVYTQSSKVCSSTDKRSAKPFFPLGSLTRILV